MRMIMKTVLKDVGRSRYWALKERIVEDALEGLGSDSQGITYETVYKPRKREAIVSVRYEVDVHSSPNLFWHTQVSVREDALNILRTLAEEIFQKGGEYTINGKKFIVKKGSHYFDKDELERARLEAEYYTSW